MSYHLKHSGQEIDKNLDLAGTALQEHQDISHLATKNEMAKELALKQDDIKDLDSIRRGSELGASALQTHQDISHLATKEELAKQSKKINEVDSANKSVTMDVATLKGTGSGSIVDIVAREIAKVVANAPAALDTLEEIANFIIEDASQASKIIEAVASHSSRLDYLDENFKKIIIMEESEYNEIEDKDETSLYMLF